MKEVSVSAPGKLILLGEHAVVYDKPCIVTAVDQRLSCEISSLEKRILEINAPDVGVSNYSKSIEELGSGDIEKGAMFIELAVRNFYKAHSFKSGLRISSRSEFKHTFGFGSSSAVTACVMKGLSEMLGIKLTEREIFDLSYKTVLDAQGVGSGFDVASAVYGGTVYFVTSGKKIEPLNIKNFNLVVGYSGEKADTASIVKEVAEKREKNPEKIDRIFSEIEELVDRAKEAIVDSNWEKLGLFMNRDQELLTEVGVSIKKLDEMIDAARKSGAYGAKLSGAGGGDCMIALCPPEKIAGVKTAISDADGEILDVKVNAEGARIEK